MACAVGHTCAPRFTTRRSPRKLPRWWINSSARRNWRLSDRDFRNRRRAMAARTEFISIDADCSGSVGTSQYVPCDHEFQRDLLIEPDRPVQSDLENAAALKLLGCAE